MSPDEVVLAFCDLDPGVVWSAFRDIAADSKQPEDRRVRAAAWLAIANAAATLQGEDPPYQRSDG